MKKRNLLGGPMLMGSLLLISPSFLRAAETAPLSPQVPNAQAGKTEKKNYLPSLIKFSEGTEKKFYEGLQKNEDKELQENLGLMQVPNRVPFGSITKHGQKPEPLTIDEGESRAINMSKRLEWEAVLNGDKASPRILIFDRRMKSLPGWQPITIILVSSDFKVLSWVESGGEPMFTTASLQTDGDQVRLVTVSRNRKSGGVRRERFSIVNGKIEKLESFLDQSLAPPK